MLTFVIMFFGVFNLRNGISYPDFFAKFIWIGAVFVPATLLHFSLVFPEEKEIVKNPNFLLFLYFPGLIFLFSLPSELLIVGARSVYWGMTVSFGGASLLFTIYLSVYVGLVYYNFLNSYKKSRSTKERQQIKYVILGTLIMTAVSVITNYIFLILKVNFPPVADVASLFMSGFIGYAMVKYRLMSVEPVVECDLVMAKETPAIHKLKKGRTYIAERRDKGEKGLKIFVDAVAQCSEGLCITGRDTEIIRKRYSLVRTPVLSFSSEAGENQVNPEGLVDLSLLIKKFIDKAQNGVILIDDFEQLLEKNSFEKVKDFLNRVSHDISESNSSLVVSFDSGKIQEEELSELKRITTSVYSETLIGMLSHPIRHSIINYLDTVEHASFTVLMNELNIKNSQILTFHINKLKDFSLIGQNDNKMYRLSDDAYVAVKMLDNLQDSLLDSLTF